MVGMAAAQWYGYDVLYAAAGTFATVALVATFLHWDLFGIRPRTSVAFVALYVTGAVMASTPTCGTSSAAERSAARWRRRGRDRRRSRGPLASGRRSTARTA